MWSDVLRGSSDGALASPWRHAREQAEQMRGAKTDSRKAAREAAVAAAAAQADEERIAAEKLFDQFRHQFGRSKFAIGKSAEIDFGRVNRGD